MRIDIPGEAPLYIDVAVAFPYSSKPGHAAHVKEGEKENAYPSWANRARTAPADFSPLVFEAFGRCGRSTERTIRKLAARSAEDRGLSPKAEVLRWFSLLGLRLALDQADILLHS